MLNCSKDSNELRLHLQMAEKEISLKELKDLADDNEIDLSARGLTTVPKALPQVFHSFPSFLIQLFQFLFCRRLLFRFRV